MQNYMVAINFTLIFIIFLNCFLFCQAPKKEINSTTYKKIKIGNQIWMGANLDVDHYRNGDTIPEVKDPDEWANIKTGAWCHYKNDTAFGEKYGKLYNWYAANDTRGLAPIGWHLPTEKDFEILKSSLNGNSNGLKAESEGIEDGAGTNKSGFLALLAGLRRYDGTFDYSGNFTYFWSSTEYDSDDAGHLALSYNASYFGIGASYKYYGYSVRCISEK